MKPLRELPLRFFYRHRREVVVVGHAAIFTVTYALAFGLRFDLALPPSQLDLLWATLPILLLVKLVVFHRYRLYQGLWRYVSVDDLERIIRAAGVSTLIFLAIAYLWPYARSIPRSVVVLDFVLTVVLVGGSRFLVRLFRETHRPQVKQDGKRVLIVGAGAAAEQTLREILFNSKVDLNPIGLVDDDSRKRNGSIHGVRVLGTTADVCDLAESHDVEEVLIAIPSASGEELRRIVEQCEELDVTFKVLPAVADLLAGRVTVQQFREVQIEDLLGRERVELDLEAIGAEIEGQTVLITGAGGSIGSELARQVHAFGPRALILLERNESALFFIDRELRDGGIAGVDIVPVVGDVQDRDLLVETFRRWSPSLVYHAAAYKHVPLMEASVVEAVRNNVFGTRTLMDVARGHRVARFVLVSTDKAVRPRNVMGATKRMAEMLMLDRASGEAGEGTRFVAVRFGNVLGSQGSVIPIFREQLRDGGPLTVTHPDVSRYFMTIPEAVQLVMQAGAMGEGGEIFVLDMGEPIRIVDLARRLITLAGKKPDEEIEIRFTGLRPGESLHERLHTPEESVLPTRHEKIRVLAGSCVRPETLGPTLDGMERLARERNALRLRRALMEAVSSEAVRVPERKTAVS